MKKSEFYGIPNVEEVLKTNSSKAIAGYSYSVPLEKGEIESKNNEINQALAKLQDLRDQRKTLTELAKIENTIIQQNHMEIMTGSTQKVDTVYEFLDNETGILELINSKGYIVSSMRVKQAQMSMFGKATAENKEAI